MDRVHAAVVCAVCLVLVAGAVAGPDLAAEPVGADSHGGTYAAVQGDQCVDVRPLGNGSQTVEEFYDYRTPITHEYPDYEYSSYGTTHLQQDDTSVLFLYEGSDGLSLVVLHDQIEGDSPGAAVTMEFEGLPEEGEWVIEDDTYPDDHYGGPHDEFQHGDTWSRITWAYTDNRSDGGAFRGGLDDDDVEITVHPFFNDEADFRVYEGEITEWQVISATDATEGDGEGGNVERTALESIEESVTLTAGGCPSLSVTTLTATPASAAPGDSVEVQATVTNDGGMADTFTVPITLDGEEIDERELELGPGESEQFTASTTIDDEGNHEFAVANTTTSVDVEADGGANGDGTDGDGATAGTRRTRSPASVSRRRCWRCSRRRCWRVADAEGGRSVTTARRNGPNRDASSG